MYLAQEKPTFRAVYATNYMQVMWMMEYLNCKIFYITFSLNNILGQIFPDLLGK